MLNKEMMVTGTQSNKNGRLDVRSLREQVYEYLRGEMQAGRIIPGSYIKLNEISQRLGISKTPLRDALIQLECEGFVTILPRRGVVLNKLTLKEIKNVLEIVGALESAVIVSVFDKLESVHIEKMRELNKKMRALLLRKGVSIFDQKYYQLNIEFHNVFLEHSHNTALGKIITPIKQRLYDFPRLTYIRKWELINCDEHDRFIQFVEAGERDRAATLWRDYHWSFSAHETFIREFYSKGNKQIQDQLELQK